MIMLRESHPDAYQLPFYLFEVHFLATYLAPVTIRNRPPYQPLYFYPEISFGKQPHQKSADATIYYRNKGGIRVENNDTEEVEEIKNLTNNGLLDEQSPQMGHRK